MGTGKMKKMSRQQQKAVGASMNEAAGKMLTPLEFGAGGASIAGIPTSLFGALGGNPSINALTNANAMAAQQTAANQANLAMQAAAQPVGSGAISDISQNVMDASMPTFDPAAKMAGMGIFGARGARNRSLFGRKGGLASAFMMHDEEKIKRLEAEIADIRANGEDSKFVNEGEDPQRAAFRRQSDIMDEKKKHKEGSPAKRGETYEEFKKRTGETSMKAYMRDNPTGSK